MVMKRRFSQKEKTEAMQENKTPLWARFVMPLMVFATVFLVVAGFSLLIMGREPVGAVICIALGAVGLLFIGIGAFLSSHPGHSLAIGVLMGLCVLFCGTLICGVVASVISTMLLQPFADMEHYLKVWKNPATVTATVTEYKSYDDEGDTDYQSYVTYEYEQRSYTGLFENRDDQEDLTPLDTVVTLKISPIDPSKQISKLKSSGYVTLFSIVLVFVVLAGLYGLLQRRGLTKGDHAPDMQDVQKDIQVKIRSRFLRPFLLLCWVGYGLMFWRYSAVVGQVPLILAGACALGWLFCMYTTIRDYRYAKNGEFEMRRDVLVDKKEILDSEGDSYILTYRSAERVWKSSVTKKRYELAKLGDMVLAVYLPGKKKPIVHYHSHGSID